MAEGNTGLFQLGRSFVDHMVNSVQGIKVMLFDAETIAMVGAVYSKTAILGKEVFLIDRIESKEREENRSLRAVVHVRPTEENVEILERELRAPLYSSYHIFFSNSIPKDYLARIAAADEREMVKEVQEYFYDFYAVNTDTFNLAVPSCVDLMMTGRWNATAFDRTVQGLSSALLALKRRPIVRYLKPSNACRKIAQQLEESMQEDQTLFGFRQECTLLLIDRREDPITPLLMPWSYQAMVHELFGIVNNRTKIPAGSAAGSSSDDTPQGEEFVVSSDVDDFFKKNMYANYGDLVEAMRVFVDAYKQKTDSTANISSFEEMQEFMRSFPDFRRLGGTVSKHVNVTHQIGHAISDRSLLDISVLEQEMACQDRHKEHWTELCRLFDQSLDLTDMLRLGLIYAIRYENNSSNHINELKEMLASQGVPAQKIRLIDAALHECSTKSRAMDLFGSEGVSNIVSNLVKGFKDVENVYTQHDPLLHSIIKKACRGKLKEEYFPFANPAHEGRSVEPTRNIFAFFVGGATLEEALTVHNFNLYGTNGPEDPNKTKNKKKKEKKKESQNITNLNIVLGGTEIVNTKMFMDDLEAMSRV